MSGGAAERRRPGRAQISASRSSTPPPVSSSGSTRTLIGATLATAGVRNTSLNPWLKPEPKPGGGVGSGAAAPRGPRTAGGGDGGGSAAAAAAAAAEAGVPFGTSLWPHVEARDPTPVALQRLCVAATAACLIFLLPALPTLLVEVGGADGGYDEMHGLSREKFCGEDRMTFACALWSPFEKLLEVTLGLSSLSVERCLLATTAIFGGLIALDLLGGLAGVQEMWPRSWNCDNARCYTEMFCEPTRPSQFLRRPGNACSNFLYFFGSFCVVCSNLQQPNNGVLWNPFWLPDCAFGLMLLALGSSSVVWHASNAPASHYVDLWSMDCCIAYLLVRWLFLGAHGGLKALLGPEAAQSVAVGGCSLIYGLIVWHNGSHHLENFRKRWLHDGCPFSGRTRLAKGDAANAAAAAAEQNHHCELPVMEVCIFAGMPVLFILLPALMQFFVLRAAGSCYAATLAATSLAVGWGTRMFERWLVDGYSPILLVEMARRRVGSGGPRQLIFGPLLTVFAALVSPTAVLHAFTGVTLIAGYAHVRSVDTQVRE